MTEPVLRPRRGAHRAPRSPWVTFAPLIVLLVAVAAVVGLIRLLGADDEPATVTAPGPQAADSAPASSAPAPPSAGEPASGSPSDGAVAEPARARFEAVVLNQTKRNGLAASVADTLRADGWDVVSTGNFGGTVSATTVYFPAGGEAAANEIAAALPAPPRVRPVFPAIDPQRLTVILTDNYP